MRHSSLIFLAVATLSFLGCENTTIIPPEDISGSGMLSDSLAIGNTDSSGFKSVCDSGSFALAVKLVGLDTKGEYTKTIEVKNAEWSCPISNSFNYTGPTFDKTVEMQLKFSSPEGSRVLIGHHLNSSSLSFSKLDVAKRAFEYAAILLIIDFVKRLQATTSTTPEDMGVVIGAVVNKVAVSITSSLVDKASLLETASPLTRFAEMFFTDEVQQAALHFLNTQKTAIASETQRVLKTSITTSTIDTIKTATITAAGTLFTNAYQTAHQFTLPSSAPPLSLPKCLNWKAPVKIEVSGTPVYRMTVHVNTASDFSGDMILRKKALTAKDFPLTIPKGPLAYRNLFVRTKWAAAADSTFSTPTALRSCNARDFNKDGLDDFVIGSPGLSLGGFLGAAYVWLGQSTAFGSARNLTNADTTITSAESNSTEFPRAISFLDINEDGSLDLFLADAVRTSSATSSALLGFLAKPNFPTGAVNASTSTDYIIRRTSHPPLVGAQYCDVNGDKIQDLILAGSGTAIGGFASVTGALYIIYGSKSGFKAGSINANNSDVNVTIAAKTANDGFFSTTTPNPKIHMGDFNKDGLCDLLAFADANQVSGIVLPELVIIWGDKNLPASFNITDTSRTTTLRGINPTHAGQSLRGRQITTGDFNADGFDDVAVAIQSANDNIGRIYVFWGSESLKNNATLVLSSADLTYTGAANAALGMAITTGDFNADGIDDFAVSAGNENELKDYNNNAATESRGTVYIVYGSTSLTKGTTTALSLSGGNAFTWIQDSNNTAFAIGVTPAEFGHQLGITYLGNFPYLLVTYGLFNANAETVVKAFNMRLSDGIMNGGTSPNVILFSGNGAIPTNRMGESLP